jgi:flavodoxin
MSRSALIVCVSVSHGNTGRVARAIAEVLNADVRTPEEVALTELQRYDVIGLGSGIFAADHHPRLRQFVDALPALDRRGSTDVFVFSTSGWGREQHRPWQRSLEAVLRSKGYRVLGSFGARGYDTWLPLRLVGGLNRGHPDAADLARAREFAAAIARLSTGAPRSA